MYSSARFDLLTESCHFETGGQSLTIVEKKIRNVKCNPLKEVVKAHASNCFDVLKPASERQGK